MLTSWDKRKQVFSKDEWSFIVACIIGDGSLAKTGRLVIAHGNSQKDYCEWKANKLSDIFRQEVKALPTRQCTQIQVQRKCLREFRYKVYPNNRKDINSLLSYISNPLEAVAIWMCDDGNVSPSITDGKLRSAAFQMFTFTELEETLEIIKWFEKNIGIAPRAHFRDRSKQGKKSAYILKFSAKDSRELYKLIKPYIPNVKSMEYKYRHIEYNLSTRPEPGTGDSREKIV